MNDGYEITTPFDRSFYGNVRHLSSKYMGVVLYPDKGLREVCAPVESFDSALTDLCQVLSDIGEESNGLAVAGPQAGVQLRVWCHRLKGCWEPVINPEVVAISDDLVAMQEGCLSIPGRFWWVNRPRMVTISYQGVDGTKSAMTEDGLLGRMIQHEVDHLNGVLIVDHLSRHERKKLHQDLGLAPRKKGKK